jgi:hypothetical protein
MKQVLEFGVCLATFAALIVVLMLAERVNAQEIAYCKNMAGDIVMIAKGSPCPQGYYPL